MQNSFRIKGRAIDIVTRRGVAGLAVEAWDRRGVFTDPLGGATTDAHGNFRLELAPGRRQEIAAAGRPALFFKVRAAGKEVIAVGETVTWTPRGGTSVLIEVEESAAPGKGKGKGKGKTDKRFRVKGQVRAADGRPLSGAVVKAFDRDLRAEEPLGQAVTDKEGRYEIAYGPARFARAEKKSADLVVRVMDSARKEKELASSPLLFNARAVEVVNLMAGGGVYQGPSEYETLVQTLAPVLAKVAPADITDQDRDFLAGETGADATRISAYAEAARFSAKTKVPAEAFYGLFRQNMPQDLTALLMRPAESLKKALRTAVDRNIIPLAVGPEIDRIVEALQRQVARQAFEKPANGTGASLGDLLSQSALKAKEKQTELLNRFVAYKGSAESFWKDVQKDPSFKDAVPSVQFTLQLGVLTQNHLPLVEKLQEMKSSGKINGLKDLAKLDVAAWRNLLTQPNGKGPVGFPAGIPGKDDREKADVYARSLQFMMEKAFPMAALTDRLSKDAFPGQKDLSIFFSKNTAFDFRAGNVDAYLAKNPSALSGVQDRDGTVRQLKTLERLYKITPRYDEMRALASGGVESAQAAMRLGKTLFIKKFGQAFGGQAHAQAAYGKAAQTAATAAILLSDYSQAFNKTPMQVLPYTMASGDGVPDWESLFGSLELCSCDDCRSVLSPAAYLVDVLAFLKDRAAKTPGRYAKDVLFERRPDLGEIELTCVNTNTPLPYVDLANEVLENAVSPASFTLPAGLQADLDAGALSAAVKTAFSGNGFLLSSSASVVVVKAGDTWHVVDAGWRFPIQKKGGNLAAVAVPQTAGAAADLAANPEHANPAAYDVLRQAVFPWNVPFHMWIEEARAYLGYLGIDRPALMTAFQTAGGAPDPQDVEIAAESLTLAPVDRQVITGTHPDAGSPWKFWGYDAAGSWINDLKTLSLLESKANLTHEELVELLRLKFINPDGTLQIVSTDPSDADCCDPAKLTIPALAEPALTRIQKFTRLWRKLGWTARELDKAITALKPAALNDGLIQNLADVQALKTRFKLPVVKVLSWYGRIDTAAYADVDVPAPKSLYEELFQNPAVIKLAPGEEDPFALTPDRTELKTVGSLADDKIRAALSGALGLSGADLALLIDGPDAVVAGGAALNLENLSRLHRAASFARALRLSVADFLSLKGMTGVDPFVNDGTPVAAGDTRRARDFAGALDDVRRSGITVAALDYDLRHRSVPTSGVAPTDDAVASALEQIRAGLKKVADDTSPVPDPVGDVTGQKLAVLGWDEARVRAAVDALGGKTVYTAPLAALPGGVAFPESAPAVYDGAAKTLSFTGPMSLAQQASLLGLSADGPYQSAVNALFAAPRDFTVQAFKTFVDPTYTAALAALPAGLSFPADVADRVSYDSDAALLSFTGTMTTAQKAALLGLSADAAYQTAVNQLFSAPGSFVPSADEKFLDAADASALFDAALTPQARFEYVLADLNAYLRRTGSRSFVQQDLSSRFKLDVDAAGVLLTHWRDDAGDASRRAIGDFLDPDFSATSDKVTRARYPKPFRTYLLLRKAAALAAKLKTSSDDLPWLLDNAAALGWLAFNTLPAADGEAAASFDAWRRLWDAARWRQDLPDAKPGLYDVLAEALAFDPASGGADAAKEEILTDVSTMTGWPLSDLESLLGPKHQASNQGLLGFSFPVNPGDPNDYKDARTWLRLRDCFDLMERAGAAADQCRAWAKAELTSDDARAAKQAAKSKNDESQWLEAARPIRDALRQKQRDALASYLIVRPDSSKGQAWSDADGLYEYFLIDVQMCSCMMTSRIKQAMASVQMFVQRCLMNLEPEVEANTVVDERWKDWDWMKNYRVWEAGRKVFLWPENWIEPELRDDKSPFFKDLETELMQNEVTVDTAGDAFLNYLDKLDQVAKLQVCGAWHQVEKNDAGQTTVDVLHVIARTQGQVPTYFYRRRVDGTHWTAWSKMEVDIKSRTLAPVIWNRRILVFWPVLTEKAEEQPLQMPAPGDDLAEPMKYWEIQLAWSEYKNGKWSPKKLSDPDESLVVYETFINQPLTEDRIYLRPTFDGDDLLVSLQWVVDMFGPPTLTWANHCFRVSPIQDRVIAESRWDINSPEFPTGTIGRDRAFVESSQGDNHPLALLDDNGSGGLQDVPTLDKTPGKGQFRVVTTQYPIPDPKDPLFFEDNNRSYFVQPEEVSIIIGWENPWNVAPWQVGYIPRYEEFIPVPDPIGPVVSNPGDPAPFERSAPEEAYALAAAPQSAPDLGGGKAASVLSGVVSAAAGGALAPMLLSLPAGASFMTSAGDSLEGLRREEIPALMSRLPASGPSAVAAAFRGALGVMAAGAHAAPGTGVMEAGFSAAGITKIQYIPLWGWGRKYLFQPFYHPHVGAFIRELRKDGIDGLLQRPIQVSPGDFYNPPRTFDFGTTYVPKPVVAQPFPVEDVDVSFSGAYSQYNWELFFHAPLLIAQRLSQNQRFEDAQKWFHYIFNPTDTSALPTPQKYWRMRRFYETSDPDYQTQQIQNILAALASGSTDPELTGQVAAWRGDPFNPHLLARLRTTAYQKATVMKYLDNLINWGDQLFRRDTLETINEATQLYVLAGQILGRKPQDIKPRFKPQVQTYDMLEPKLDDFSNALVSAESLVPAGGSGGATDSPPLTLPAMMYFCVPKNDKLLSYWDTVADRLYKIRHCMNIEGQVQQLPLFEPPLDPGMLVRAAAAGVDISSALSDISAALPPYRFSVMSQKAAELCGEVRALGQALLNALDKRDAEGLALLRAAHETKVLQAARDMKRHQLEEAAATWTSLNQRQTMLEAKQKYYQDLLNAGSLPTEQNQLDSMGTSKDIQIAQEVVQYIAGGLHFIPDLKIGCPTTDGVTYGGSNVGAATGGIAAGLGVTAAVNSTSAGMSGINANFQRRAQEWQFQADQSASEIDQVKSQIQAAQARVDAANADIRQQDVQIENSQAVEQFMRDKFTAQELYDWTVSQVSAVYFQGYQLAYDVAKRAERSYRHELAMEDAGFIRFGYWDSLKKGLLSAEKLGYDIKRMEASFLDQNKREYELSKTASLGLLDPAALVRLKQTGECFITLPESLFDADHPGHYMRRLKSVALTVPCVAGPYSGVNASLTLMRSRYRKTADTTSDYPWSGPDDARFREFAGAVQSIATSSAQNDSGLFELNFRDERYLPFEGQGAFSEWRLRLDKDVNRFDFDTISDVLFNVRYTAREGGDDLKAKAKDALPPESVQFFSARHEFSDAWYRFLNPADDAADQSLLLDLTARLPFQPSGGALQITGVDLYFKVSGLPSGTPPPVPFQMYDNKDAAAPDLLSGKPLTSQKPLAKIHGVSVDLSGAPRDPGQWLLRLTGTQIPSFLVRSVAVGGTTYKHLNQDLVEDMYILIHYTPA